MSPSHRARRPPPVNRPLTSILLSFLSALAGAQESTVGLPLADAIRRFEDRGLTIVYSSDLIRPDMRVSSEPSGATPRDRLIDLLAPFDIAVTEGPGDTLLLTRSATSPAAVRPSGPSVSEIHPTPKPLLPEIIVSSSQYSLVRGNVASTNSISVTELESTPDFGDDPLRTVNLLPGIAGSNFSAKTNVRGGQADETLILFDDLRLYNPYHLKDFQSFFSAIDPQITSRFDVYTGTFPAPYGDRMSGVISIEPIETADSARREIALSFFNASLLSVDTLGNGDTDWLIAARRGNLDVLLEFVETQLGEPNYVDLHGRLVHRLTDDVQISGNFLLFDDNVALKIDDDEEEAVADYRDLYYWLRADFSASENLTGSVLLARSELDSKRRGIVRQPGIATGTLEQSHHVRINSLQTKWVWEMADTLLSEIGGEIRISDGRFRYRDDVTFDLLFDEPGTPTESARIRNLTRAFDGEQYAAYLSTRWMPSQLITVEGGLRWDRESLSSTGTDQVSPRLNLLIRPNSQTAFRAGWGRYFQAQAPNELQISDGETDFYPAQSADHFVVSFDHSFSRNIALRIEAYEKTYKDLQPRYENLLNTFVFLPELKPDRVRVNPDRAKAKGVEFLLSSAHDTSLTWWLSYGWSEAKDEIAGTRFPRNWDQTHTLRGGLAYATERWEIGATATYRSGWPTTAASLIQQSMPPLVETGSRNGRNLSHYRSVDARIARHFKFSAQSSLTLFAEITNLFNRKSDCCAQYELDVDAAETTLNVETEPFLPRFPSAGFIWRF